MNSGSESKGLDDRKLLQMKLEILKLEQENIKTGECSEGQMADKIRNIIANIARQTF